MPVSSRMFVPSFNMVTILSFRSMMTSDPKADEVLFIYVLLTQATSDLKEISLQPSFSLIILTFSPLANFPMTGPFKLGSERTFRALAVTVPIFIDLLAVCLSASQLAIQPLFPVDRLIYTNHLLGLLTKNVWPFLIWVITEEDISGFSRTFTTFPVIVTETESAEISGIIDGS